MPEQDEVDWKALRALGFNFLAGIAGLFFFFGGRLISTFWGIDRILAEMIGIGAAVAFGVLAALLRSGASD